MAFLKSGQEEVTNKNNKAPDIQRLKCCDRATIRTWDRLLRRQMLYPAELRDHCRGGRIRTCGLLLPKQAR